MNERTAETAQARPSDPWHTGMVDRFQALLVLISVTFFLLAVVDFDDLGSGASEAAQISVSVVTAGMLLLALAASAATRRSIRIAAVISVVTIVGTVVATFRDSPFRPGFFWLLLVAVTPIVVLRRIAEHKVVTNQTVLGGVCAYLLIALAFSYAFLALDRPELLFFGEPEPTTAFPYFSLVTATTLGYGDLSPATEFGRILAGFEAVIGQVFLVIVVARLVSLWNRDAGPRRRLGLRGGENSE